MTRVSFAPNAANAASVAASQAVAKTAPKPLRASTLPRVGALALVGLVAMFGSVVASVIGSSPASASISDAAPVQTAKSNKAKTATPAISEQNFVDVIDVDGFLDPVTRDFILTSIDEAVANKSQALIIKLDSPGSLLSQSDLDKLETAIANDHRIPIAVWIGDYQARAKRGAARLVAAADVVGVAGAGSIGNATPTPAGLKSARGDALVGKSYSAEEALKAKLVDITAPVLVEFVGQLDGKTIDGHKLVTVYQEKDKAGQVIKDAKGRAINKPYGVRFAKLGLLARLLHMATNPSIAYLFLLIGMSLFVFEFFTGGIGVAAVVGLMAFVLAASGLGNLPTRPLGVALLVLAMIGFSIDIQSGTPRFWSGVGVISLVVGSLTLFAGDVQVPLAWVGIMVVMVVLFMINGMPTMVRTRFATPTIGRDAMIGEIGTAREAVNPDGIVIVRGAPWRARTNRATPIAAGDQIRVASIDGLLLEVEPLEGAAKEHRG
jgi:membrane-bound serine protease (ClpP class)